MITQISKARFNAITGLMLSLPAALFIFISVMKFQFGIPSFYDGFTSILQKAGLQDSPEWVLNFIVIVCPLLALLLNVSSVLSFNYEILKSEIMFHFSVKKGTLSWSAILLSGLCLLILFMYLFIENCNCH